MKLDGTQTHANLKAAFEAESAAGVMYRWSAQQADVEGQPEIAKQFMKMAEVKIGQALGYLEYLSYVGDPASGSPIGDAVDNLAAAKLGESAKASELLPGFVQTARDEGLDEIAEWFEAAIEANEGHALKFAESLEGL